MGAPAVDLLSAAIFVRLQTVDLITAYDGEVPDDIPLLPDGSGRVAPYVVLYAGAGRATTDSLAGPTDLDGWTFQVTVAAGAQRDCLAAVRRVRAELTETEISATDGTSTWRGVLTEQFDPGPMRRDNTVQPNRFYLPLMFLVPAVEGTS